MRRIVLTLMVLLFSCKKDKPVEYLLTVKTVDGGYVSTTGGIYKKGETVTISATPDAEYNFVGWDGTTSTDNPLTITLESDLVISPIFQKVKYSVKINIEGEDDWGTVTEEIVSSGKKTDYSSGTVLKLTAVPSSGIAFYNWNRNVLDTLNPYQITVDGNKEIDVKFDYKIAKDIVGTWELNLDSENSGKNNNSQKSNNTFFITIGFGMNSIFQTNINGVTTNIFAPIKPIGTNALVLGSFAVLSNVNNAGASLSFNLSLVPTGTPTPTSVANIPASTSSNTINFSGAKSTNTPPVNQNGLLVAPASIPANTSSSSLNSISSQAFNGVFNQITTIVSATTVSATTVSATTVSATTASSTTASSTLPPPCSGSMILVSASNTDNQTVSPTTSITEIVYQISTNCTDTTTVSATGLPPGVTSNYTATTGRVKLNGAPTSTATGTYNYSILVMYAPTSDATASSTVNGSISIAAATASSTTASPCAGTTTLISGPASQTTDSSVPITEVVYQISTNCTDTTTVSATGLPPGVSSTYTASTGRVKLNGTTTSAATGTYNYSILVMYAAADDPSVATASDTVTGAITIAAATASSTTASPCAGTTTLISGPASQTTDSSVPITEVVYQISTNCTDTTTVSATGLPPGVSSTYTASTGRVKLNGTTTSAATGTYNYSILVMYAAADDPSVATASDTVTGAITIATATASSTTAPPCSGSMTLDSALTTDNQVVSPTTAITEIVYQISTNCTDTTTVSATGLPPGVNSTYTASTGRVKLNGTPTSTATGTYNYSILAIYDSTSGSTASSTVNGSISIAAAAASSTTAPPCSGSMTLDSALTTDNQVVSPTTAITEIVYQISTNCTDTTTLSVTGLPPGVTSNYVASTGRVKLNGTPTSTATGTYNYSILAIYDSTSGSTASSSVNGSISIAAAAASSTTTSVTYNIDVTASSSSDYTLDGSDRDGTVSGQDPDLTFAIGDTINFNVNASGHPFYIKTAAGTGTGDQVSGLTNNGTESATISWTPNTSGTYYYQCSLHGGMVGTITIQ